MKPAIALSDKERFPLIDDLSFLQSLKQDEYAPKFNFQSGDRLNEEHLKKVCEYEKQIRFNKKFWNENEIPNWLDNSIRHAVTTVPFYNSRNFSFFEQPTIRRSDLQAAPWLFASSETPTDDLLVYQTSGTTGPAMDVLFDPVSQACWLPQLQSILDLHHIELSKYPNKVAIALICSQSSTLTYASLSTYLNGAGVLKINLNSSDWKDISHRVAFLEKFNPEILTGDPFAFISLMELNPNIRPKAMVSSAMKLTEALRKKLEEHFQCLVLDVYSLTECRMVAFAEGNKHRAIRHDLYLEVFDKEKDVALPYGQRGELVITGGNNPFLPLIRYRTGDHCSLEIKNGIPYLIDLEARNAVAFYTMEGKFVNNIEISRVLADYPFAEYTLHQNRDKSLLFTGWCNERIDEKVEEVLKTIFGGNAVLKISILKIENAPKRKTVTYTSEFSL